MKVYLFPNLSKANCENYTIKAFEILRSCGIKVTVSENYMSIFSCVDGLIYGDEDELIAACDMIIAIGGDGTILTCAGKASHYKKPILGINCGRLGFMASLEYDQLDLLKKLVKGEYTISSRMMLETYIKGSDEKYKALNDVILSKSDGCKISDFEVIKDSHAVTSLRADGVIFSTATGATAYSMSAGGVIIEPEMQCIEFTPICPHSLFARSMIFSQNSEIKVKVHLHCGMHDHLMVDGNVICELTDGSEVYICASEDHVDIIDICGGSFFSSVNSKLMMPLKGKTEEEK